MNISLNQTRYGKKKLPRCVNVTPRGDPTAGNVGSSIKALIHRIINYTFFLLRRLQSLLSFSFSLQQLLLLPLLSFPKSFGQANRCTICRVFVFEFDWWSRQRRRLVKRSSNTCSSCCWLGTLGLERAPSSWVSLPIPLRISLLLLVTLSFLKFCFFKLLFVFFFLFVIFLFIFCFCRCGF